MATSDYIQLPPDNIGKRVRHNKSYDLEITNINASNLAVADFGDPVTFVTSGVTAILSGYASALGTTTLYLVTPTSTTITDGEDIQVNGVKVGESTSTELTEIFTPNVSISDREAPQNNLAIDTKGAAFMRFAEGGIPFDAFGHAQFSQYSVVDGISFLYGDEPLKYYDEELNGGSIAVDPPTSTCVFSTPITDGAKACRTTNQYYPYVPGIGTEFLMSMVMGDTGKAGVTRRWGVFDDSDGIYFEFEDSTLKVGVRSSVSGSVVDQKTSQDIWNGDRLESADTDAFVVDVSKSNVYFIDYQWLGVGAIRFGIMDPNGKRTIVHTIENANEVSLPYMKRGSLPFRFEQVNTATTGSTSEMRLICASAIKQAGGLEYEGDPNDHVSSLVSLPTDGSFGYLGTFRPKATINGQVNRKTAIPTELEIHSSVADLKIEVEIRIGTTFTSSDFQAVGLTNSSLEYSDPASTTVDSGGARQFTFLMSPGGGKREFDRRLESSLKLSADGVTQGGYSIFARPADESTATTIKLLTRWEEVD